jgi:hypothetical protein
MLANTWATLIADAAGAITATTFPRRMIPICSPALARSTSSGSFCLASNNPTVRMGASHFDRLDMVSDEENSEKDY